MEHVRDNVQRSETPWAETADDALHRLGVSQDRGLTSAEARKRIHTFGANVIQGKKPVSAWIILARQLKNIIVVLLAVASAASFLFGKWLEGLSIGVALLVNVLIGFFMELRARRSIESLKRMTRVETRVIRNGETIGIASTRIVPGDIVELEAGDVITADLRILESSALRVNESALTGESLPVEKDTEAVRKDAPLSERRSMLFNGTAVTMGSGKALVVSTGMDTELGRIASLTEEAREEKSPIEKRLEKLGYRLVWVTLAIGVLVILSGIYSRHGLLVVIETAIALAVAAIPEGLPVVATIALANGMRKMAHHNALINRLSSVETLGATSVIFTDKTGTLTENRMKVTDLAYLARGGHRLVSVADDDDGALRFVTEDESLDPERDAPITEGIRIGVLCNNASLDTDDPLAYDKAVGDPMETALLHLGARAGIHRRDLLDELPEIREVAFDPETKMMATVHRSEDTCRFAVKGAPESVIPACTACASPGGETPLGDGDRESWERVSRNLAGKGLRVLAVAGKTDRSEDVDPYEGLTLYSLVGFLDPPRHDVKEAIATCRKSGIRVVMVTGDQEETARYIGVKIGITDDEHDLSFNGADLKEPGKLSEERRLELIGASIFARVSPQQKLDLISLHQQSGSVVAMTGDGVNDAPALKKADIGISMGKRGTQVAREASDIILKDDAFRTIVVAIEQGRTIFDNIRKFIVFLLSGNVGEIMIVSLAMVLGIPLPLKPLQILYLNMLGDVFPALALAVGRGHGAIIEAPPRPSDEPILTGGRWAAVLGYGFLIALTVTGVFLLCLYRMDLSVEISTTIAFLTLAFARLWHVFNMRHPSSGIFRNEISANPWVWGSLALCCVLLVLAVYVPGVSDALELHHPGLHGWMWILGMSLVPWIVMQPIKRWARPAAGHGTSKWS